VRPRRHLEPIRRDRCLLPGSEAATVGRYRVGVYGEFEIVEELHRRGVVNAEWQTYPGPVAGSAFKPTSTSTATGSASLVPPLTSTTSSTRPTSARGAARPSARRPDRRPTRDPAEIDAIATAVWNHHVNQEGAGNSASTGAMLEPTGASATGFAGTFLIDMVVPDGRGDGIDLCGGHGLVSLSEIERMAGRPPRAEVGRVDDVVEVNGGTSEALPVAVLVEVGLNAEPATGPGVGLPFSVDDAAAVEFLNDLELAVHADPVPADRGRFRCPVVGSDHVVLAQGDVAVARVVDRQPVRRADRFGVGSCVMAVGSTRASAEQRPASCGFPVQQHPDTV